MGKSPAKWLKSVLLGKKGPKAKNAKGKEKAANEGEVLASGKAGERDTGTNTIASHLSDADSVQEIVEIDNNADECSPQNAAIMEREVEPVGLLIALDGPERRRQDQSATMVQASFRGYLARRAYSALKGIIKLQALIRGHLVRRQAVSTLHCMLGIVKLQAHVRGIKVRLSDIGLEVQGKVIFENIWESRLENAGEENLVLAKSFSVHIFSRKFLALSPKPLYLKYDLADPNSVTSWLDRWSVSKVWNPIPRNRKGSTSLDQNISNQGVKTETGREKRNNKQSSARIDNGSIRSSFEVEKSRRTFRKPSIHSVEISDPEAAKSELEKVKRSLRKVHESVFHTAAEDDKPKPSPEIIFPNSGQNVSEQSKSIAPKKTTVDPYDTLPNLVDLETSTNQHKDNGLGDSLPDFHTSIDTKPLDDGTDNDKIDAENEHPFVKQDVLHDDNQKINVKVSSEAKQESTQNGSNKQSKVPSYMLATKSAKAKLKDSSSLFEHETPEKSLSTRRHSLPSATGTKVNSSLKAQKLSPGNVKPKKNSGKPLSASKDGSGKADWRR